MPESNKTNMTKVKDCVHSVPFKTKNEDAAISSVYINRPFADKYSGFTQTWDEATGTITLKGIEV